MATLRVAPDSLRAFASVCGVRADELRHALPVGEPGPHYQATSMSLTTADSSIESACGTLAVRAEELAIKVAEAAAMYLGEDESSAVSVKKAMRIFP
ncbi:type VII secretion target [Mycolicibacterium thermoresistibile]|nr:hypothetical protein [Mycolicibacterium thermoresistibile]GAT14271.1 putative uncharacterized protein [Mycolicibacterium thermoresistibile]SNW20609.1 Protein of uncharacterised function (DUF2580) [Mycolicibacterium thermoresistibile]